MLQLTHLLKLSLIGCAALLLSACGGGGDDSVEGGSKLLTCNVPQIPNAAGTACIDPPPIKCPAPTVPDAKNESCVVGVDPNAPEPVVFPTSSQAVLFYKRADANYEGYRLHTWNNDACSAYQDSSIAPSWDNGLQISGVDPNYGAYWILALKSGYAGTEGACGNFIIHKGTDDAGKEMGGGDQKMPLGPKEVEKFARMAFTFSGVNSIFDYPLLSLGVSIADSAAHWLDSGTLLWNVDRAIATKVQLHYSDKADLAIDTDSKLNGQAVLLEETALTEAQQALVPHLSSWHAYRHNLTADQVKNLVKNQLVLAAYDAENTLTAASYVQVARVLDDLYTKGPNDADEATLGLSYDSSIKTSLWAPTARDVKLKVYNAQKVLTATQAMTLDSASGIWSYTGAKSSLDRQFYRFEITVYHPATKKVETYETTDPYSVSLALNGRYSQFVNLSDADLKPTGWDGHEVPEVTNPEDSVIYEGHIRDFSIRDNSVSAANRGKYLAFTESQSAPVQHLKALADSGVTHFHLLPATDMATVNEDASKRVELTDTVAALCKIKSTAAVCSEENAATPLIDVLKSYAPSGERAQALVEAMRGTDGFNWGYDPQHFNVPEGSYASNADGVSRIKEMRAMNQALHSIGLRVVLDVVYNHTSSSGVFDNSVFDKVVPGYFHRYNPTTGSIERSTCCENTATEHKMMDKFVKDSLVLLAKEYGFDSFRFDIMGHHPKAGILAARDAVKAVDPDTYFYGEGWNFGEVADDRLFVQARQANMAGTEVGTFNDRIRDAVRSAALFNGKGTAAELQQQNYIEIGLAGTLKDFLLKDYRGNTGTASGISWNGQPAGYATDPADIINYVSKHDNEAIWDKLQLELHNAGVNLSLKNRVRVNNIALAIPLLSQGIPFLQMGDDLLRSKSLDRNSYDAGDWFNFVDFSKETNNWNVGLPLGQDNRSNWTTIAAVASNPATKAAQADIEFSTSVFQEFLQIRKSSPLFRLTTGQEVMDRVGFHNIGKTTVPGLIVMSIDDGQGLADLDPAYDALVVVINGTATEQSHTVPTATGFSLHSVQQQSVDPDMQLASFATGSNEGTFTVPAYSAAVFVKVQQGAQGPGLKADATMGAPDIPPYQLTTVYLRGAMNGWGTEDAFSYDGEGVYSIVRELDAGDYEFKVASENWSTVDFGSPDQQVSLGVAKTLSRGASNLKLNLAAKGMYQFRLDASNPDAPVLTVSEPAPYGETTVFVRGDMNGWGTTNPMQFGGGLYKATITMEAKEYNFKIASEDWSTVDFGSSDAVVVPGESKVLQSKGGNLKVTPAQAGEYSFELDASDPAAPSIRVLKL
ncbi:pullulanase-type alpha-1,6-glucosidase [Rheinheimera sp.]|uniref:pullulanase-type alpha-1,6-glucosidase n=1 Tax=Rheinheimera sp. TaxID=1869214 RepID=UPI00307CE7AF